MAKALSRLLAAYQLELRLLCFHWAYPVLCLFWVGLMITLRDHSGVGTARSLLAGQVGMTGIGLLSLAGISVSGASASRSERAGWKALEEALPTGAEVLIGRWCAVMSALMGPLIIPLILAATMGPLPSFWRATPDYIGQAAVALAFTSAATWWLVESIGPRPWLAPLLSIGVLGLSLAMRFEALLPFDLPGIGLLDLMRLNQTRYSEIWGYDASEPLRTHFNLFYFGLGLLCITLAIRKRQVRRVYKSHLIIGVALTTALVVALGNMCGFVATAVAWNEQGILTRAANFPPDLPSVDGEGTGTNITAYAMEVDLTRPSQLLVDATLTLQNRGQNPLSNPILTLNQDLEVISSSVPFKRSGHLLLMELFEPLQPGETREVKVQYMGTVWYVTPGARPSPVYFTTSGGVKLGVPSAWYPLAGHVPLETNLRSKFHLPVSVRMRVTGPEGWQYASNIPATTSDTFTTDSTTWISLIGSSRLTVETHGPLTVVAGRDDMEAVRPHIQPYTSALTAIAPLFPQARANRLTLVVTEPVETEGFRPDWPTGEQLVVVTTRDQLDRVGRVYSRAVYVGPLIEDLWYLSGEQLVPEVQSHVTSFLWRYWEADGNPAKLTEMGNLTQPSIGSALLTIYIDHGKSGLARAIGWTIEHAGELVQLPVEEQERRIRAAVVADLSMSTLEGQP